MKQAHAGRQTVCDSARPEHHRRSSGEQPELESFSFDRQRIPSKFLYPTGDGGKVELDQPRAATKPIDAINYSYSKGVVDVADGGFMRLFLTDKGPVMVGYQRLDFGTGVTRMKAQCHTWAGVPGGKKVEVRLDTPDGSLLGVLDVPSAAAPINTVLQLKQKVSGVHDLYLINLQQPYPENMQWAAFNTFQFE